MCDEEKKLLNIVRNFDAHFDDELSVNAGMVVQFVQKIDRMWFKVYYDGQEGKIPINNCQEWLPADIQRFVFDPTNGQAGFVAKFDFIKDAQEGDLVFAANEVLIGLYLTNENWWYGTRLNSILWKENTFFVKQENCGIFPITHVWMFRTDLLPSSVFSSTVCIQSENNTSANLNIENSIDSNGTVYDLQQKQLESSNSFIKQDCVRSSRRSENLDKNDLSNEKIMFHVKVIKTMKAQLAEEIDLEQVGDTLAVLSIPDKHYFYGSTIDGSKRGIFPKSFVKLIEESRESSPEIFVQAPPTITPPPLPSSVGELVTGTQIPDIMNPILEDPPSYEVAIKEYPLYSGYSNQMLDEIESYGQVIYDFVAQQDCELTVYANQIVRLIRHFDHEWLECEKDTKIGFVPKSYVKIIVDCERSSSSNEKNSGTGSNTNANLEVEYPVDTFAEAIQDFYPQFDHDLPISAGDRLRLLKHFTNTDWVQAQNSSGNIGLVPLTYLKSIQKEEEEIAKKLEVTPSPRLDNVLKNEKFNENKPVLGGKEPSRSHRSAPPVPREPLHSLPYPTFNQFNQNEKIAAFEESASSNQINDNIPSTSRQIDQSDSKPPQDRASVTIQQRQCIITELIQTEKDYSLSLGVFVRVIRHMSEFEHPNGFDSARITDDMDLVLKVSKKLLKLFENHARDRAACDQKVGICFLQLKNEIQEAYMRFCKNHSDLKQLIQTYESQHELGLFLQRCQKRIQEETNCFDLNSVIIKPIQRILKYPLLLNELIGCTENDHVDKKELQYALELITKIASDINELKRRQDIVEKYCKQSHDSSFVDKISNLNYHSLVKKFGRIKNRLLLTVATPLFEDKEYDDILQRFQNIQKVIENFLNKLNTYLNHFQQYSLHILYVSNAFLEYLGKRISDVEIWRNAHLECRKCYDEFISDMRKHCVDVLKMLSDKFRNPNSLILKRDDKRLDYEQSLKSRTIPNDDSRGIVDPTKSHFEALNIQLKEELPRLTELSLEIFMISIRSLIVCHRNLYSNKASIFIRLHDDLPDLKNIPTDYYENIEQDFRIKHNILSEQMIHNFSILTISDHSEKSHFKHKNWIDPIRVVPVSPSIIVDNETTQNETMKREIRQNYQEKDLFFVTNNFNTGNIGDLVVENGDLVGIIKYKDPMGSSDRYFVDRGNKQKGCVPKSILKSLTRHLFETQNSSSSNEIVNIMDQSHCYDQVPHEDEDKDENKSLLSFDDAQSSILTEFDPIGTAFNNSTKQYEKYFAAYDFTAQDQNQLSLKRGQQIIVQRKCDMKGNSEWWLVEELTNKRSGYVPANYLSK